MRAARRAFRRMILLLTRRLSPCVSLAKWARRKGVTSLPRTPRSFSSSSPVRSARSWSSGSSCSSSGMGLAMTSPECSKPSSGRVWIRRAASPSSSTAQSSGLPESVRSKPGERREVCGGGDGRGPVAPLRGGRPQVARGELRDLVEGRHQLQLVFFQPDPHRPAHDAYGGWHCALRTHHPLRFARDLEVVWAGQAVGDQGGLQRHDRSPCKKSLRHLGADLDAQAVLLLLLRRLTRRKRATLPAFHAAGSMHRGSLFEGLLTKRLTG